MGGWLQLERRGNTVTGLLPRKCDGPLEKAGEGSIDLPANTSYGQAVAAHLSAMPRR